MKFLLSSNFIDYYDHAFDGLCRFNPEKIDKKPIFYTHDSFGNPAIGYCRHNIGSNRKKDFKFLQQLGFYVPAHGTLKSMHAYQSNTAIVLYDDEMKHCGEGKRLFANTCEALKEPNNEDKFSSLLITNKSGKAESYRWLNIGHQSWTLKYSSDDVWRSNCGNVVVSLADENIRYNNLEIIRSRTLWYLPMFAIDFVVDSKNKFWAIDFNTVPGIRGTPLELSFKPSEIVELIREYIKEILFKK